MVPPREGPGETPAAPSPPVIVSPPVAAPPRATTQDTSEVRQGESPSRTPTPRTSREPASSTSPNTAVPPPPSEPSKESAVAGSSQAPLSPPAAPVAEGAPILEPGKGMPQIPPQPTPAAGGRKPAELLQGADPVYQRSRRPPNSKEWWCCSGSSVWTDGSATLSYVRSDHKVLIQPAIDAWEKFRYTPAQRNGVLVEEPITKPFQFKLQ